MTFTDPRDGKTYETVKIGNQIWMAQNLSYNARGSRCYEDDPEYAELYGRLYTWEMAIKACPLGWHLPSADEWSALTEAVGGEKTAGKHLKAKNYWDDYKGKSGNGTDSFGFSALPGGFGDPAGLFPDAGSYAFWWSNADSDNNYAYSRSMSYIYERMANSRNDKSYLFSVRCVKDT